MLASPRYGERWARHWLDGVRFAESHGFEMNQARPNAWRYRDWVIQALNDDEPYDQFVRKQLAGDSLGADEATGFLVAGAWDQVKSPDPVLTAQQRADELHDIVSVTGSAFLGLTVGCARCHDHKFDPVSVRDYHAIKAVFAGVQHGDRPIATGVTAVAKKTADGLRRDVFRRRRPPRRTGTSRRPRVHDRPAGRVVATRNVERFAPVTAKVVRFTVTASNEYEPCIDELEIYSTGPNARNVARDAGVKLRSSGNYPGNPLHKLEHLTDGRYGNSRSWISNQPGKGWVEIEFPAAVEIDRMVWGRDREGKYADRVPTRYRIEAAMPAVLPMWKLVASSEDRARPGQPPAVDPASGNTRLCRRGGRRSGGKSPNWSGRRWLTPGNSPARTRCDGSTAATRRSRARRSRRADPRKSASHFNCPTRPPKRNAGSRSPTGSSTRGTRCPPG
ncbi:hypothetical protein FRUB_08543 [Fimbriiglobus ruber]|uniref:DUF1549 domain-containing protein n=1 Tax=Fimbriiglobus ruber TaxID=1908690 RepID=A0A225D309_9BACT|nr:hypothetical protein FRUB_08543 [Fimbriiglobus ruber]